MRKTLFALTGAALLSACGGGNTTNEVTANQLAAENAADATNYQAEVMALSPQLRDGVFLRALRDAGFNCQEITEVEAREPVSGNPAWRVQCSGVPHIVSISRDGTAKILSRSDAS